MGGELRIVLTVPVNADSAGGEDAHARRRAAVIARRISRWAARLTRFDPTSELTQLNGAGQGPTAVGPTLGAVLAWANQARQTSNGIVDVTLLAERLGAEGDVPPDPSPTDARAWRIVQQGRRAIVERSHSFAFDLGGVAKGWLADRALALLTHAPGAIVDADGDVALAVAPGDGLEVGIADPFQPERMVGMLRVPATSRPTRQLFGIATSGVSVHRWGTAARSGPARHHLIDPRTGRPAATDLVQATVVAASARMAEVLAKTTVILGLQGGMSFLESSGAEAGIVVTGDGECLATPASLPWLAAA